LRIGIFIGALLLVALPSCGELEIAGRPASTLDPSNPEDLAVLVTALESGNRGERIVAARELGRRLVDPYHFDEDDRHVDDRDGRAVRALADAVIDDDPWVRRWSVIALGRARFDRAVAVPALARALADDVEAIRVAAGMSLGMRGESAAGAADALIEILKGEPCPTRDMAAWALGVIGSPVRARAEPVLLRRGYALPDLTLATVPAAHAWKSCDEERVLVRVDRRGHVEVKLVRYGLRRLTEYILERAETKRECRPPYASAIHAAFCVDEHLPWVVVQSLLTVCAHPDVRLPVTWWDVRQANREKTHGVFELEIPRGLMHYGDDAPSGLPPADAILRLGGVGEGPTDPTTPLEELAKRRPDAVVGVCAERWVPVGDVMRAISMVVAAGLRPRPEEFLVDEVFALSPHGERSEDEQALLPRLIERARAEAKAEVGIRLEEGPR
jgi:HEAT repeats